MQFPKVEKIKGELTLPGDKSISHRSLLFSAMADGGSVIKNLSDSDDVKTTINCLKKLGVKIQESSTSLIVEGVGKSGFKPPSSNLDCGNSGTTCRLLSGILAAQKFPVKITGDKSLSSRPMQRIIEPLEKMGCIIESNNGKLPIQIKPSGTVTAINYELPVVSAQVKSAILLAGLHSSDTTTIIESNLNTRDHTERMLNLPSEIIDGKKYTKVSDELYPVATEYFIPGDISTASFFIVLTSFTENSELLLKNVSLNETRMGIINILKMMGADISSAKVGESQNEPYGSIIVRGSVLKNVEISKDLIPAIIDEIPILAVAGAFAKGDFFIRGANELRVKESDRISSICSNLKLAGLNVSEFEDGYAITGNIDNSFHTFESYGDHRIAMAFAVMSSLLNSGGEIRDFESVSISNPDFLDQLKKITIL